jgi:hypothetical protein
MGEPKGDICDVLGNSFDVALAVSARAMFENRLLATRTARIIFMVRALTEG